MQSTIKIIENIIKQNETKHTLELSPKKKITKQNETKHTLELSPKKKTTKQNEKKNHT